MHFRLAVATDAGAVAALHADSWRRRYRGAYSDAFLDGDVHEDRVLAWTGRLMTLTARAVVERGTGLYLWVLEQNADSRAFYEARGGRCMERAPVPPSGGMPDRLNGSPAGLRYAWLDPAALV